MEGRSGGLISFTVPVVPVVAVPSPKPKDKAPTMLTSLPPAMASMLLPAPLVLLPTVGEIDLPRPSMAAPVPSHPAPLLPLDALPDENQIGRAHV